MANDYYQGCEPIEPPNEEEAWVYHTIHDSSNILEKYGAEFFITKISNDALSELSDWFYSSKNPEQERAWLLMKQRG